MNEFVSGGISGAITDPMSAKALKHAKSYYEEIRHRADDVVKIQKNIGYTLEQILKVKNYLFVDTHVLSTGIKRFDPCFEIAESWQRISDMPEYIQPHDKLLIPHELLEISLITKGYNQEDAHKKASLEYNYAKESNDFYERLQKEKKARISKGNIISGGISRKKNDWDLGL